MTDDIAQADPPLPGQGVAERDEDANRIGEEVLADDAGVMGEVAADADVDVAAPDQVDEVGRHVVADAHRDAWVGEAELPHHRRQQRRGDGRHRGDGQDTAAQGGQVAAPPSDRLRVDQQPLQRQQHVLAGLGEGDVPVVAFEQLDAERLLELLDLHGQRRLRHVQLARGADEAAQPGHGQERPHLPEPVNHRDPAPIAVRMRP